MAEVGAEPAAFPPYLCVKCSLVLGALPAVPQALLAELAWELPGSLLQGDFQDVAGSALTFQCIFCGRNLT